MEKVTLLAELRALADNPPDFGQFTPTSRLHLEWLGKGYALVMQWNQFEAVQFKTASDLVVLSTLRDVYVGQIMNVLHRAVASLELEVGGLPAQAFGPGAVYDVNKALRDLLASATSSLFLIDPYMDEQIFDAYLASVSSAVSVRLLTKKASAGFKTAIAAFVQQKRMAVEARLSETIHDRVFFFDDRSCWVLGQSVKDAAKSKPTYLAPLSSDVAKLKKDDYDVIWSRATSI